MSLLPHADDSTPRGFAIAHLHRVESGPDILTYLSKIDATLEPFHGQFIIHGGAPQTLEDTFTGALIVIEFPSRDAAAAWYASDAYQVILPLRLRNAEGWAIIAEGVEPGHVATDVLSGRR